MSDLLTLFACQIFYVCSLFGPLYPFSPTELPGYSQFQTKPVHFIHEKLRALPTVFTQTSRPQLSWEPLIERLSNDGFDTEHVQALFQRLNNPPEPLFMAQKVVEVARIRGNGKASLTIPPELAATYAPPDYNRLAASMSASSARDFIKKHQTMFDRIYKAYSVPAPFVVAILMVETGVGANLGKNPVLLTLGSMATTGSYSQVQHAVQGLSEANEKSMHSLVQEKSDWAYGELKALLRYAAENNLDIVTMPSSVYGAIGLSQFMPSNIAYYGVDGNGDKKIDLFTLADAAHSIARYLAAHGWSKNQSPAGQIKVLRSYNHSDVYAATVYGVAMQIMSPSTVLSGKNGGNAVTAARKSAEAAIPKNGKSRNQFAIPQLRSYTETSAIETPQN